MKGFVTGLFALGISVLGWSAPAGAASFYEALLDGSQTVPSTSSSASGQATFVLNDDETALDYTIKLQGVTLKPDAADRVEPADVDKIHLHFAAPGANGPHVLNIFGLPSEDDDDLNVDYQAGILTGTWDNGDATDLDGDGLTTSPGESKPLSDFVAALKTGQLYLQVHTKRFAAADGFTGELRGQVLPVSEPVSTPEPSVILGILTLGAISTAKHLKK